MPSICLSSALINCVNGNLFPITCTCYPIGTGCCCAYQVFGTYNWIYGSPGAIKIMKGVVPAGFSELTDINSRNADLLISFTTPTFSGLAITNCNPNQLSFYPQIASASGAATWFWMSTGIHSGSCNTTQYNRLWGTVGLQSSGADLEISDTNIVAGNVYKVLNLRIGLPQSYTY